MGEVGQSSVTLSPQLAHIAKMFSEIGPFWDNWGHARPEANFWPGLPNLDQKRPNLARTSGRGQCFNNVGAVARQLLDNFGQRTEEEEEETGG